MRKLLTFITSMSILASSSPGLAAYVFDPMESFRAPEAGVTATAAPTATATSTATATASPTATATAAPAATPTAAATAAPTATPTAPPTAAATASPTATATATPTATPTAAPTETPSPAPAVTAITLSKTQLELTVGESCELTASFEPEGTEGEVSWITDSECVTVANGNITAVSSGTAVVMAVEQKSGKAASCYITVKEKTGILELQISEGVKQVTAERSGVTSEVIAGSNVLEAGEYTLKAVSEEGFELLPYSESVTVKSGESVTAAISAEKSMCTVTLPEITGCTVTPVNGSVSPVEPGGSYSFTVSTGASFNAENMTIKANGEQLTAVDGIYTISDIRDDVTVSVDGVEAMSWDATLKSLKVLGSEAVLGGNDTYTVTVPYGSAVTTGDIEVVTNDTKANYTVTTADGRFTVTVTAEDGTKKAYSLSILQGEKTAVDEAAIAVAAIKPDDAVQSSDGSYTAAAEVKKSVEESIAEAIKDMTGVTATVSDAVETKPSAGTLSSPDGTDGAYSFTVTLTDGTSVRTAVIEVRIKAYEYVLSSSSVTAAATTITVKDLGDNAEAALYTQSGRICRRWTAAENGRITFRNLDPGTLYVVKIRDKNSDEVPSGGISVTTIKSNSSKSTRYYVVTFDEGSHGTIVSGKKKQSVRLARAPEFPEVQADEGYIFKGWSSNGVLVENPSMVQIRSTTEFTAIYERSSGSSYGTSVNRPSSGGTVQDNTSPVVLSYSDVRSSDWFYQSVMSVTEKGYMNGTGGSMFEPNATLTRAMLVTILYRYAGEPEASGTAFSDVPANTWYTEAVTWAADAGIVNGTAPGIFAPEANITREQLAAIMYRYAEAYGYDTSASGSIIGFADSAYISDWAQTALIWTIGAGIIGGRGDNTLDPGGYATRAEAAAIIERFDAYIG